MNAADWATVAGAVIAFVAMIGSAGGWVLARREKNAAAEHERRALAAAEASADHERRAADAAQRSADAAARSADAGERAAAAQETIAAETTAAATADLEAPWYFERAGGIAWLLHNRLGRRAYGVKLSSPAYMKRGAEVDKIDGYSSHKFLVINGEGDPLTVTWHWREDCTDEVPPWTGLMPK